MCCDGKQNTTYALTVFQLKNKLDLYMVRTQPVRMGNEELNQKKACTLRAIYLGVASKLNLPQEATLALCGWVGQYNGRFYHGKNV